MSLETRIEKLKKQQQADVEQDVAELDLSEFDDEPYDRAVYQPKGNYYGMPGKQDEPDSFVIVRDGRRVQVVSVPAAPFPRNPSEEYTQHVQRT